MWQIEKHKKGRRHYGWFAKNDTTGVTIYIARRWHKEIFRTGEATISDAMRKGIACWAIDCDTLQLCKIKGAKFIGVKVRDQGTLYLTTVDNFYNPKHTSVKNYTQRGGSLQRFLPLDAFRVSHQITV